MIICAHTSLTADRVVDVSSKMRDVTVGTSHGADNGAM
jgi:hypothetical protein